MIRILHLTPGDDEFRTYKYEDSDGVAIDISSYTATATFTVKSTSVVLTELDGLTIDGPNGLVTFLLDELDTQELGDAGWFGKLRLVITSPTNVTTTLVKSALVVF